MATIPLRPAGHLLAAAVLLACQPRPSASTAPPIVTQGALTVAIPRPIASSSATAAASAPDVLSPPPKPRADDGLLARRSHRRREGGGCPDFASGMAIGRKRTASGDYQGALEGFEDALRARPADARAWAELGYAALLAGKDAGPALLRARVLTKDPTLLAQVWFNEGLLRERQIDPEGARLAFAVAETYGSKAAGQRLGAASRCTATWTTALEKQDDITFFRSWREVLKEAPPMCFSGEAKTEAEAKRVMCFGCPGMSNAGTVDACAGPPPWTVPMGYQHFHNFSTLIQPLAGGRFHVQHLADHDGPEPLEKHADAFVRERLAWLPGLSDISLLEPGEPRVTSTHDWSDDAPDEDGKAGPDGTCAPALDADVDLPMAICAQCGQPLFPARGLKERWYYAPATGKALLRLTVWSGDVKATIRGSTAVIAGGGCQATIAVAGP